MPFLFNLILLLSSSAVMSAVIPLAGGDNVKSAINRAVHKLHFSEDISFVTYHRVSVNSVNLLNVSGEYSDFSLSRFDLFNITDGFLEKAVFYGSDLTEGRFNNTKFIECDFSYTDLRNAKFVDSVVGNSNFYGAKFNMNTLLPFSHSEAIERGMVFYAQ